MTNEDKAWARRLAKEGKSARLIVATCGCSLQTARKYKGLFGEHGHGQHKAKKRSRPKS